MKKRCCEQPRNSADGFLYTGIKVDLEGDRPQPQTLSPPAPNFIY